MTKMNKKAKNTYRQLAQTLGFRFDEEAEALYGTMDGYDMILHSASDGSDAYVYVLKADISAFANGVAIPEADIKKFKKENKPVTVLTQDGNCIHMTLHNCAKADRFCEQARASLKALCSFLRERNFESCCQFCGTHTPTDAYMVSGSLMRLCPDCYTKLSQNATLSKNKENQKKENLFTGIIGALLGSLLGVLCIILLSQMGYVAALSGFVMAVCTLKGYELLGSKLSGKGIAISAVIMLIMTYIGDRLDWAIVVMKEFEVDFGTAYQSIPMLLNEEVIEAASYWGNLILVYAFVILGAVPTIMSTMKKKKLANKISKLQ